MEEYHDGVEKVPFHIWKGDDMEVTFKRITSGEDPQGRR